MKTSKRIGLDGPRTKGFSHITVKVSIVSRGTLTKYLGQMAGSRRKLRKVDCLRASMNWEPC